MRKLKVYGWNTFLRGVQVHCIVAATSWKEASKFSGDSLHHMQMYGSITGNDKEIELASSKAGTIFYVPVREQWRTEYIELNRQQVGSSTESEHAL